MVEIGDVTLAAIRAARARIADSALRTPLVRLEIEDAPAEIWLKLENLQPIGSFKLRGAGNAMALCCQAPSDMNNSPCLHFYCPCPSSHPSQKCQLCF